jgi:hypothetical protein
VNEQIEDLIGRVIDPKAAIAPRIARGWLSGVNMGCREPIAAGSARTGTEVRYGVGSHQKAVCVCFVSPQNRLAPGRTCVRGVAGRQTVVIDRIANKTGIADKDDLVSHELPPECPRPTSRS